MDAPSIVGRDPELARLRAFVTPPAGGRAVDGAAGRSAAALLLVGEPGLGKTTLWQAGVDLARHERLRVLAARPAEPESRLGFSGLADLLGNLPRTMLASLPPPQRRALEIALVLADATSADTPEERAVGPAVLGVLRAAAARRPILVAIDDLQWLDVASADALAYALRRAGELPVRVLLARRPGAASRLEASAGGVSLDRLDLAPLSPGAIRRVVRERLGLELSHRSLRALHDRSGGSPLAALELARLGGQDIGLDDEPRAARGADLDDVVGLRVERLPKNVRTLLAAVAMAAAPRVAEMELLDRHAYARALQLGALVTDADRVRLGHPLLGAAAVRRASPVERRVLHGRLAAVVEDAGQRLRHRALAAEGPDPGLAAALAAAALAATRRGAHEEAADLADAALRLTPADAAERPRRLLDLVERLLVVGEHDAARRWLDEAVTTFAPGPQRATARVLQGEATYHHAERPDVDLALDLAMQDGGDDPRTRAWILARRASYVVLGKVDDLPAAERALREAIDLSRDRFPDVEREALRVLAWAEHLRGESLEPVRARFEAIHGDTDVFRGIDRIQAERWAAEGRLADAHAELERLLQLSEARGEVLSLVAVRLQLIEVQLRSARWAAAEALLDEWLLGPDRELASEAAYDRCRAMLAAGRGDAEGATRLASRAIDEADAHALGWDRLEAERALGLASLAAGRFVDAAAHLRFVWDRCQRAGVTDPSVFPVAADLVEALVATDAAPEALAVTAAVDAFALDHPTLAARAAAARCRMLAPAVVATAPSGAATAGSEEFARLAAGAYAEAGLPFDAARTWLALGGSARRARHWGMARTALETAAAAFDEIDSPGWAARARDELGRVGARRPRAAGSLTEAEQRVAALAADGLTNKEIAHALTISVDTVEAHLSHVYAKLGVASRVHLARRVGAAD